MSDELVKADEVESITTLAAKSFARVLELERREGTAPIGGRSGFNSVDNAFDASPEDLTWQAMARLEDE